MKKLAVALTIGAVAATLWFFVPVWLGSNFHPVVAGRVYRSGEMRVAALEAAVDQHRLRSIVNLRGREQGRDWYEDELRVARARGLVRFDLDFSARLLPPRPAVVELIHVLRTAPEPILLHCRAGADRAGFASVLARMVKEGVSLNEARSELSIVYGHLPFGPSREIARMFDMYDRDRGAAPDSMAAFERWLATDYVPYGYRASIEARDMPDEARPGEPLVVHLVVTNTSPEAWIAGSGRGRGIKVGVRIRLPGSDAWREYDRAELGRGMGPGESRAFRLTLGAPRDPGEYTLKFDLVDEFVTWFEDQGSEALVRRVIVRGGR